MGVEISIMEAAYRNWENENFDPVGKAAQRAPAGMSCLGTGHDGCLRNRPPADAE